MFYDKEPWVIYSETEAGSGIHAGGHSQLRGEAHILTLTAWDRAPDTRSPIAKMVVPEETVWWSEDPKFRPYSELKVETKQNQF